MPSRTLLSFLAALGAGVAAAVLVSRIITPPFAAVEQALGGGETELTVMVFPGDEVARILEPGQIVDVIAEELRDGKPPLLTLVASKVPIVGKGEPKGFGSTPEGKPASTLVHQVKLRVTKEQAEAIRPYQQEVPLRFIVRQRIEPK
jgi:Flp pilus assembly protein CpaB